MPAPTKDAAGFSRPPANRLGAGAQGTRPPAGASPRRTRPIYRVFVSSTWLDLQPERRALMEALNRMEEMRFVGMEFFGNRPDDTHDASIDQVELCEVFVGIIGFRYGSGITEAEYRRARELGLPCFVYFKREDASRPELTDGDDALAAKLAAFKQDLLRGHTVKEVASPEELAANATADLHNWVAARWISVEKGAQPETRAPVAAPDADRTNILRLLERIQHDWIEGVLDGSLHHRAWMDLGLDWRDDAVEHPWDQILVVPDRQIHTLGRNETIAGIFSGAQNTLLILGEPGAGKTTTLLELTRELLRRGRAAATEPAPVVLALSTWSGRHATLEAWLTEELTVRYQVPKRLSERWLSDGRLVLLLDGLDEVRSELRPDCVRSINAFARDQAVGGLVVTCRVHEYSLLPERLRLRSAICLQPLTPAQIDRYFERAGSGLTHLRMAMRDDPVLQELAQTPLMLSVMTMAWRDAPADALRRGGSAEERRGQLLDTFVNAALRRPGKAGRSFSETETRGVLSWLAGRMRADGQTIFVLEQIQPGWLDTRAQQFVYFATTRITTTLALVLPFLVWNFPLRVKLALAGLGLFTGFLLTALDFRFSGERGAKPRADSERFWISFGLMVVTTIVWIPFAGASRTGTAIAPGLLFITMVTCALCVPLNVRVQDIRPADTILWSWRLAGSRLMAGIAAMNLMVGVLLLVGFGVALWSDGWKAGIPDLPALRYFLLGVLLTTPAVVYGWRRIRPGFRPMPVLFALTAISMGAQIVNAIASRTSIPFFMLLLEISPAAVVAVFGGFAPGVVDPTRPRHAGAWFWLRVPALAFIGVTIVMTVPGLVGIWSNWKSASTQLSRELFSAVLIGAGFGFAAFFRFGGFNGVQHAVLRILLRRAGRLPARAEAFFARAAQMALMQRVGFGYRFMHALLLDHLAARDEPRATSSAPTTTGS